MKVIQQSNSQVISFGPFVDKTDGFTELSGLVSAFDNATTGIMLSKNGGTFAVRHATVTTSVYDSHGYYKITLDATDTNTLGLLRVMYSDPTTCLPVWEDCLVIPAAVKAPLAGTALLTTNVTQWLTAAAPAMTGDAFASLATLLTRIASTLTITSGKVDVNDKTGFSISGTKTTLDALNDIAAAAVWSAATRTLTSFGTLASDVATSVWGAGTRTLTSFGTLVADVAAAVWGTGTKVLTSFGTLVADTATAVWGAGTKALTDKAGFSISGTKQTLDALHDLSIGDIDARLEAFDPPTKAELDAAQLVITNAISALHNATQGATAAELAAAQLAVTNAIAALHNATQGATKGELDAAQLAVTNTIEALHNATQGATKGELDAAQLAITNAMPSVTGLALEATLDAMKGFGWTTETLKGIREAIASIPAPDISSQLAALLLAIQGTAGPTLLELEGAIAEIPEPDLSGLALEANVQTHAVAALTVYDPPTRAEAIADKEAVLAALASAGITVADILAGDLIDTETFPEGSLGDRIRKLFWVLCNRLVINDVTGAYTAYKNDGTTPVATGTIMDDGTETERSAPVWP